MGPRLEFHSSGVRGRLCPTISTRNWNGAVYADDCNIYVRSRRAGERVVAMGSLIGPKIKPIARAPQYWARKGKLTVFSAVSVF